MSDASIAAMEDALHDTGNAADHDAFTVCVEISHFEANRWNVVARKVSSVNLNAYNLGTMRKLDDAPVMTSFATATRLPSIHDLALFTKGVGIKDGWAIKQHVVGRSEPLVSGKENLSACGGRTHVLETLKEGCWLLILGRFRQQVRSCMSGLGETVDILSGRKGGGGEDHGCSDGMRSDTIECEVTVSRGGVNTCA
jgi:hypothetical protein